MSEEEIRLTGKAEELLKDPINAEIVKEFYRVQEGKEAYETKIVGKKGKKEEIRIPTSIFEKWKFEPTLGNLARYFSSKLRIGKYEAALRLSNLNEALVLTAYVPPVYDPYYALEGSGLLYTKAISLAKDM